MKRGSGGPGGLAGLEHTDDCWAGGFEAFVTGHVRRHGGERVCEARSGRRFGDDVGEWVDGNA